MVADVSNLVNILATQPVQQMQSLGQKIESAQASKAQQEQQAIENYRKSVKDNLEMQVNIGKLRKDQLEATKTQMEVTAGVSGSLLQTKDPLVRQQLFEQAVPILRSVRYTDEQIEAARGKIGDDNVLKGWIAQGAGVNEVYKTHFETPKPPDTIQVGEVKGGQNYVVNKQYNPTTGQYDIEIGRREVGKGEGPQISIYGDRESLEYTKRAAAAMDEATKQANIARQSNASMQYGQQLLKGLDTGSLSDVNVALGKMAASIGMKFDGVSNMEAARGAFADMVKNSLSAFPGAISEGERAYAISVSPQLTSTPEGRAKLVGFLTEINSRAIEYQRRMDKYIASNPKMNLYKEGQPSFNEEWDNYVEKNPLSILSEEKKGEVSLAPEQWNSAKQAMKIGNKEYRAIGGKWVDSTGREYKSGK